ncbi:hypothetical protein HDU91_003009, partial [Kappamyces sp. JEL0680]
MLSPTSLILLAAHVLAALDTSSHSYPSHIRGQKSSSDRPLLENVFFVKMTSSSDCATYVLNHLASKNVARNRIAIRTNYNLNEYGNFCSVSISGHADAIFDLPGVQMFAVHSVPAPKPLSGAAGSVPTTSEGIHTLTGVADARNKLNLTGKGVKVAVIDTGVFYKHPALGGCFGANCK